MASIRQIALFSIACSATAALLRSRNATQKSTASVEHNSTAVTGRRNAPCTCEANNPAWGSCAARSPKCIFVDLGAADGNSFNHFMNNGYGPVANCPSGGQWEAYLVEANPQFTPALNALGQQYPGKVHPYGSTAAYTCQGSTSFSIDPDASHNHWGSSMKKSFGSQQVTVPTVNVIKLVQEHVLAGDYVILKVDIEGAEYDLLPCLAQFSNLKLIDVAYVEEHSWLQGDSVYSPQQYAQAKVQMQTSGINVPDNYHSQTL